MSGTEHQFRSATFGGFHRQDVLDYLESSARQNEEAQAALSGQINELEAQGAELAAALEQAREENVSLQSAQTELRRELESKKAALAMAQAQLDGAKQTIAGLERTVADLERTTADLMHTVAGLEPDARAYALIKERAAVIELEAHQRAQVIVADAQTQAEEIRQRTAQWLRQVDRQYDGLRTEVETAVAHAAGTLERVQKTLTDTGACFSGCEDRWNSLLACCRGCAPHGGEEQ